MEQKRTDNVEHKGDSKDVVAKTTTIPRATPRHPPKFYELRPAEAIPHVPWHWNFELTPDNLPERNTSWFD